MSRAVVCIASLLLSCPWAMAPALAQDEGDAFLNDLQRRTFRFFWETTDHERGLVLDRYPSDSPSSVAAIGFGLTAYGVGVERGWVSRVDAAERVRRTLQFLDEAPQGPEANATGHRGFFFHFLTMEEGRRWRRCELSSIDTCLLMGGVLFCGEYFDRAHPLEAEIRTLADRLYRRVEWNWMQPHSPLICMAWHPERGFGKAEYKGYNEAMLLYLLALGSPTHPIAPEAWKAYTETYDWRSFHGAPHVNFGPLFGHQYSHVWVDFRGIRDAYMREKGIDYFENSRRATLSQRGYAIANPLQWRGYHAHQWGFTACDGPADETLTFAGESRRFHTYFARGVRATETRDDGTLSPTAPGGSVPFAPEITIPTLQAMRRTYGDRLYGEYGFLDSFNPSFTFTAAKVSRGDVDADSGWVNGDYLGIDQGPIVLMIENYRSGLVWKTMRKSVSLQRGLRAAGFEGGWLDADAP